MFLFINVEIANKRFDINDIIKYLLILNLPSLFLNNKIFALIINTAPITFNSAIPSIKNANIIRNTVESCFYTLYADGSNPYLTSIFSLSIIA